MGSTSTRGRIVHTDDLKQQAGEALAAGAPEAEDILAKWKLARYQELTWDEYQVAAKRDKPAAYARVIEALRQTRRGK